MMLRSLCRSVQAELDALFARLHDSIGGIRAVSAQAFSKARRGFSAMLFVDANDQLLEAAEPVLARHLWHGLRPIAADGSRLRVSTRGAAFAGRPLRLCAVRTEF